MEIQMRSIMFHLFLSLLIHTQIQAVGSLDQASVSSIDVKRHHLTVETMPFSGDFVRRQLAGGGGSSGGGGGGGGSRGGSSGGGSSGGGSRGSGGGGTRGGGSSNRGGSGGSGGNKGGKGGGSRGGGDGDGGGDNGSSGNTRGGGGQVPVVPGGRFPSDGVRIEYSLVLFIFMTCLVTCFL
ncbi:hypothetical protein AtNW77_Chr2g0246861 [Arabidopsis thaliana]|uniref:Glycine-rich protein n=2 Tax=Arabidopsis TaxID=3701 RepID=A0A178VZV1_ARATH|nr:hypothetical protein ISN45_At02g021510 [Arabidopsis thaliana x Arabidopsis arenosa]OAP11356.1 hypothetical protein AXX17_AT2G23380 [Arabidopsis thaliana]